jgi:hypothetical protein
MNPKLAKEKNRQFNNIWRVQYLTYNNVQNNYAKGQQENRRLGQNYRSTKKASTEYSKQ